MKIPVPYVSEQLDIIADALDARGNFEDADRCRRFSQVFDNLGGGGAVRPDDQDDVTDESDGSNGAYGANELNSAFQDEQPYQVGPDEMTLEEQLLADRDREYQEGLLYEEPFNMFGLEGSQGGETLLHGSEGASYLAQQGRGDFPPRDWPSNRRGR